MQNQAEPYYGNIQGTLLILGYGSIGKGLLPMVKKHFTYQRLVIMDPNTQAPCDPNIQFIKAGLDQKNYIELLDNVFKGGKGFCVNVSVETSSFDLPIYCQSKGIFYIDTCLYQWVNLQLDENVPLKQYTIYTYRSRLQNAVKKNPYTTTAISCCGANPGMVSWLTKKALIDIARDTNFDLKQQPKTKQEWANLMMSLGVKGIHIAQRDTQRANQERRPNQFWNTWSINGLYSEGWQQASELGWGTHQKNFPKNGNTFDYGPKNAIYLDQLGMKTKVWSWVPTTGQQFGYVITHSQCLTMSDFYTVRQQQNVTYRPTVMYAYHCCEVAIESINELIASEQLQPKQKILTENDIVDGYDELGVLVYGHAKNAYWFGNKLSIQDTIKRIGYQNATGLQVTSAVLAGMAWALKNPNEGVVECDDMDYKFCLEIQQNYIGQFKGFYTNWNPLEAKKQKGDQCIEQSNAWDFKNMIINEDGKFY